MLLSAQTKLISGILLITVPSIEYGGVFLLQLLTGPHEKYIANPLRQGMFRAGHAHAGVLIILSLVCQVLADAAAPAPGWAIWIARIGGPVAAILMPLGFFLSVTSPQAKKPNGWILCTWIGGLALGLSMLSLGILLVRSAIASS